MDDIELNIYAVVGGVNGLHQGRNEAAGVVIDALDCARHTGHAG